MNLLHSLLALWPTYLAFAVTLMFIGQVPANHHVAFDHIRPADRIVVLLNAVLPMSWRSFRSPPPFLSRRCAADTANEPPRLALPLDPAVAWPLTDPWRMAVCARMSGEGTGVRCGRPGGGRRAPWALAYCGLMFWLRWNRLAGS
jgi:hypothetical protein